MAKNAPNFGYVAFILAPFDRPKGMNWKPIVTIIKRPEALSFEGSFFEALLPKF